MSVNTLEDVFQSKAAGEGIVLFRHVKSNQTVQVVGIGFNGEKMMADLEKMGERSYGEYIAMKVPVMAFFELGSNG